jgi:hypothetical protein|tara:strand:- start:344 stop:523 length:180 start_codon:yes stop_codon:yes gene_type:complete
MKQFKVLLEESHVSEYNVLAVNEADAVEKILAGGYEPDSTHYIETLTDRDSIHVEQLEV